MFKVNYRSIFNQIYRFYSKSSPAISTINEIHQKSATKTKPAINFKELKFPTKVPLQPHKSNLQVSQEKIEIDEKTIQLLERLSLVNLDGK